MMKPNKEHHRISIKSKIWFSIVGTVVAVVAALWLLQVVYLERSYLSTKRREFSGVVSQINAEIEKVGLSTSRNDLELYNLASEHVLCIDICNGYGKRVVNYEGLNYNCYIHENEERRWQFINYALNGEKKIVSVTDTGGVNQYFISATSGTTDDGEEYIATVSVALAPVREASLAIRKQLMVVSSLLILAAMAISFWITRTLTKNILMISNAAKQVAHGNLDVEVSVNSNDELGDLATSFTEMTREISKVSVLQKELVANISHDIRTPLTMIRGYADAIKDITGDDKEMREHQLDIIISETNRLNVLVNDVMDLSLMQAGQSPINKTVFDIRKKAETILSRFELLEQTSDFEFSLNGKENIFVLADEVRIEQVLYNLINNAVNHIGEKKCITVEIEAQGEEVLISIVDTGTGIAKDDLPLIWDRYYKPYKKTERKSVGTGLGLSIVKAILVNHNSRFGVTSTLGKGSRFWFTLKTAKENE